MMIFASVTDCKGLPTNLPSFLHSFIQALCVWVYYNTFIKMTTVSVSKMVYMYNLLSDQEQAEFLEALGKRVRRINVNDFL